MSANRVHRGQDVGHLAAGGVVGVHVDPADHSGGIDHHRRGHRQLATTLLTTLQGGLLLTKAMRDPEPLETALSTMIDHIESLTIAKPRRS